MAEANSTAERAGGNADDDRPADLQFGEERCMGIGLGGGRCIGRDGGAQITEPRWCDDAKAVADEIGDVGKALIVAAACAMDGKERNAGAFLSIFDRTGGSIRDPATPAYLVARVAEFVVVG
jgi:hypothetical protein